MTYKDVNDKIKALAAALSVPYAYNHFEQKTSPPFLVFDYPDNDDFFADNKNYQSIVNLDIYYCSDEKDFDTELVIENWLNDNDFAYEKNQDYIADEYMWQITYSTEVLINEQS